MEQTGYKGVSSIRRQETFETDPKFTARSKSGGIKKGSLSLPIIGPRHQHRVDKIPNKLESRAISPEIELNKTYTKSLLGNLQTEELKKEKKASYRLNLKRDINSLDDNDDDIVSEIVEKKKKKKNISVNETRQVDAKSVDSGDSLKENKPNKVKAVDSGASSNIKTSTQQNTDTPVKGNLTKDKRTNVISKESKINDTKSSDSNTTFKERKPNDKKHLVDTNSTNKQSDQKDINALNRLNNKGIANPQLKKQPQENSRTTTNKEKPVDNNSPRKPSDQRDINALNRVNNKGIDNLQLKKQPQDSRTTTNKEKPIEGKLNRENLREKLTSTPVSNFDTDIAIKPRKVNASHVQLKETKPTDKLLKQSQKDSKEQKTTTERLPPAKVNSKRQQPGEKELENLKTENKQFKVQTTVKSESSRYEEAKKNKLKNTNSNNTTSQDNTSSTVNVKKEISNRNKPSTKVRSDRSNLNEHKRSSESLESGFASYRPTDNQKHDNEVDDVISLISYTETEVGKPPEETKLDRPRSDKSKISRAIEESRPVSNKSKDFLIQNEKSIKSKDYREFQKNRPPSRSISSEGIKTDQRSNYRGMEPVAQRKPGSERMTETYEAIYEERRTLLEAEVAYKSRIRQLEDESNQFLKTIDDLRSENKVLRKRIDLLENAGSSGSNNDNEKLKITIQSLETQNKALETKYEKTEARMAKLEQEGHKLISENDDLTSKLTDLQVKYSKVDNEPAKLKLENLSSTSKEESDISKYEKELNQLHIELRTEQAQRKKMKDENTILRTDKDVLKDEVSMLRSMNKNLEAINEEFKNESPITGEFPSREKMELKSQIIKLQTDNQVLSEENIKLKAENLKQVKSIHHLEKTSKTFQSSVTAVESHKITEIQDLKNENVKLKSELKDLKENYAGAESKIKSLETENKTLEEALDQKKGELSELMSALNDDKFDDEIQNLKSENLRLRKEIEEKDNSAEDSRKNLEEIKIEKDKFETEKNKLSKKINEMLEINNDQKKQMAAIQENLDQSRRELDSTKEKLEQIQIYESEISELKTKVQSTETERDRLLKQKQDKIDEIKLKMDRNDADHKEQTDGLRMKYEKEIEVLKKQIEFLQKEIDELRELKAIESELKETKDELQTVKEKYSQMVVEVESKSDLEQKNFQMNVRMTKMNNTIKQLERDQKEWLIKKSQFDDIEASYKRLQEENLTLRTRGGAKKVPKQIDKQIEFLERKQKDAETRVKQLEGWVGNLYDEDTHNATYVGSIHPKRAPKKKAFSKVPPPQTTIRIDHNRPRSLDDVVIKEKEKSERSEKLSHSSTPNLPAIEPETRLTFGLGYSQIHRSRIKAAQKYRK